MNHIPFYLSGMNNIFFQINKDIPWQDLGNGVERQLFGYDDKIMMVKVRFQEGAVGAVHQHPHVQVSYVESGQFELIGDEVRMLSKGDGYFVPPNILHGCVCKEAGVLVDTFTPLREDFIV
ncbi:cupin domain-containing protein [Niabella ginsengisoli]|uniref:Cupin domain-containing protein n=1 Tax=Niabella ginsengisoli TaxID=522298 RepID=A0ABS9SIF9_9BACT|nr:cupin domain-containing protein [Niabella ginsengisoli]MCH5598130.1 cupin domain-containing protein [Niabella ginsengisoli]